MKKDCEGCRALDLGNIGNLNIWKCSLEFNIDKIKGIPLENCSKPKSYKKWFDLKDVKEKYNLTNEELANWKF